MCVAALPTQPVPIMFTGALIQRDWHAILSYRLDGDRCPDCRSVIPGVFHAGDHSTDSWRTGGGRWRVSLH